MGWMKVGGKKLGAYATLGFDFMASDFPFPVHRAPELKLKGNTSLCDTGVISTEIFVTSHQFHSTPALSFASRCFLSLSFLLTPHPSRFFSQGRPPSVKLTLKPKSTFLKVLGLRESNDRSKFQRPSAFHGKQRQRRHHAH